MSLPDKDIENFWMTFKCCLKNVFKEYKIDVDIDSFSNILNIYQKEEKYDMIEYNIHKFMCRLIYIMCKNFMKNDYYEYYLRIIITNFNRWKKLRNKYKFFKNTIDNENIYYVLSYCLKYNIRNNKYISIKKNFFKNIDTIIHDSDYNSIIDYAISIKNYNILDIVNKYYNVISYINNKYLLKLPINMSGIKILKNISK